ncbi:hypothetical protein IKG54_00620 [Candidatus Saccharibacteria bacterium]|nr:hypothetical protein [Candidatus Saccharibacteria bacterium]
MANKKSASKTYLKVLGVITIIMGVFAAIFGIAIFCLKDADILNAVGAATVEQFTKAGIAENAVKAVLGTTMLVSSFISVLEGILMLRAAKNPEKSTLLLVLLVLSTISGAATLFMEGFSNIGTVIGNIASLTVNVLALIATFNIRSEIK